MSRGVALPTVSLCSGIGGLDIGFARGCRAVGLDPRTVLYVEREAPAVAVLVEQMRLGALDRADVWDDLRSLDCTPYRGAWGLCAGFPCQAHSSASRGRRTALDLWPDVLRVITQIRPSMVFLENVQRKPIERAARELHALGYRGAIAALSSAQVGAADDRRRWWLLAHLDDAREPTLTFDAEVARVPATARADWWSEPRPDLVGVDDGLPRGLALRLLGNSVNPAQAEAAFLILWESLSPGPAEPR